MLRLFYFVSSAAATAGRRILRAGANLATASISLESRAAFKDREEDTQSQGRVDSGSDCETRHAWLPTKVHLPSCIGARVRYLLQFRSVMLRLALRLDTRIGSVMVGHVMRHA